MKSKIYAVSLFIAIIALAACNNSDISAPNMPEVQFTQLRATHYTVFTDDTATLHARVIRQCPLIKFQWTTTDGYLQGTENDVIFTAPPEPGTVDISCTVTHPGRIPVTKTVTITVKEKPDHNTDSKAKWIGTPRF